MFKVHSSVSAKQEFIWSRVTQLSSYDPISIRVAPPLAESTYLASDFLLTQQANFTINLSVSSSKRQEQFFAIRRQKLQVATSHDMGVIQFLTSNVSECKCFPNLKLEFPKKGLKSTTAPEKNSPLQTK